MAGARRTVYVGFPGGEVAEFPARAWASVLQLAKRHGVDPRRAYSPAEGLRLAAALRRGAAKIGQLNRPPYAAFTAGEERYRLMLVVALAEEGRGLVVVDRPRRS
jgi:hypothetical protein